MAHFNSIFSKYGDKGDGRHPSVVKLIIIRFLKMESFSHLSFSHASWHKYFIEEWKVVENACYPYSRHSRVNVTDENMHNVHSLLLTSLTQNLRNLHEFLVKTLSSSMTMPKPYGSFNSWKIGRRVLGSREILFLQLRCIAPQLSYVWSTHRALRRGNLFEYDAAF